MSYQAMSRVMDHSRARGADRMVLMAIARHDYGKALFLERKTLAKEAGVSVSSVKRSLDELTILGELRRTVEQGRANHYEITLDCPKDCPDWANHHFETRTNVEPGSPKTRTSVEPGSDQRWPTKRSEKSSSLQKKTGPAQEPSPWAQAWLETLADELSEIELQRFRKVAHDVPAFSALLDAHNDRKYASA